jgi:hypothetical protein
MITNYEIKPNVGYGDIKFGTGMDTFVNQYGEPDDLEHYDDDEATNTTVLNYWQIGFSAFFVGVSNQKLAGIEVDHPKTTLYGKQIIGYSEEELIELMKKNGHEDFETENEEVDKRISYEQSMMDFFFREGVLVYMNFGVFIDTKGNIEIVQ